MYQRIKQWYIHRTIKYYNERYFNLLRRFNNAQPYEDVVVEPFTYGFFTYNRPKLTPTFVYESVHDFLFIYINKYIKNNILKCYFFVYYLKSVTSLEDIAMLFEKAVKEPWFHAMMFIKLPEETPWWTKYLCSQKTKPMEYDDWRVMYSFLVKVRRNDVWLKEKFTESLISCPLKFSHKEYKLLLHDVSSLPKDFQTYILNHLLQKNKIADIFQTQLKMEDEVIWKTWDNIPLRTKHSIFYNEPFLQDMCEFHYFKNVLLGNHIINENTDETEIFL